jgi:hypothetical protein
MWSDALYACSSRLIGQAITNNYKWYGARGITVCDRWLNSFADFLADMGPRRSPKHSIDRVNNDGNYESGNCCRATVKQQVANRRPRLSKATRKRTS